jgi:hypothetical protein
VNRDDIIRMAREAGLAEWHESIQQDGFRFSDPDRLERFAALVAAAERESCAKVCDNLWNAAECAEAIRARGQA